MNIKNILLFLGGFGIGAACGVIGSMKYFQNKYQKRYEEDRTALEEYYKRTDEYAIGVEEDDFDDGINSEEAPFGGRMTSDERSEIKKSLNRTPKEPVNYAGMYENVSHHDNASVYPDSMIEESIESGSEDLIVCANCSNYDQKYSYCNIFKEHVSADDSCDDFEKIDGSNTSEEEKMFDEHQKNKNRSPKIISQEAYSNLPANIEQEVLYFYYYDQMLTDENNEPIEEPAKIVGDALEKYGFIDNDELLIFVLNYELSTCYEIQKINSSWTDTQ